MVNENYLASARQQFLYYKSLGEKAIEQLEPAQLFIKPNDACNSIAIIIQHMAGNMLSRWTDFLSSDGEKEWRDRDEEFEVSITDKETLMKNWEAGWKCLFNAIDQLQPGQLMNKVMIRAEAHSVVEAINRQLAHYPYHIGQIIFYAKQLKADSFKSLSIPKNQSVQFNKEKFNRESLTGSN